MVARNLAAGEATDFTDRLLGWFGKSAKPHERTARLMERTGMETLKSDLLRFIPYIEMNEVKPE